MTEDNRDQYGRKDEKLKIYRIPLNFKIDASVLGFTIEWKRLFESLAVGAICFLTALMIGGMCESYAWYRGIRFYWWNSSFYGWYQWSILIRLPIKNLPFHERTEGIWSS